jgi:MFS family permease
VVLAGIAVFTLASVGCALSTSIGALVGFRALQGLAAGAGMVVSRVIVRDLFPPVEAQRVLSQVTLWFGLAPAVAPLFGGILYQTLGWHSIFWLLAGLGCVLGVVNCTLAARDPGTGAGAALPARPAAARLCATGVQRAIPGADGGQRHSLQRHVPVRAERAGVPGGAPEAGADAVLLVLHLHRGRRDGRCLDFGPAGRPRDPAPAGALGLPADDGRGAAERGAEPVAAAAPGVGHPAGGAVCRSAGR